MCKMWIPVASFMDAWIEIPTQIDAVDAVVVASFMDAWIEIDDKGINPFKCTVASFMDAWIEIVCSNDFNAYC